MVKKNLSDVLTAEDIVSCDKQKIFIFSGVGSGKNYFVEHVLAEKGNILYVSSRRAKVDEILFGGLGQEHIEWKKEFNDVVTTTNYGIELLVKNEKFGSGPLNKILEHFDYFVIDEAHSLFTDSTFASSAFHVNALMTHILINTHIKVILMTGTPEPLKDMLDRDKGKCAIYNFMEECINVVPKRIELINKRMAINYIRNLPENQKTIYYANHAKKLVSGNKSIVNQLCEDNGLEKEAIAISIGSKRAAELSDNYKGLVKLCAESKKHIVTKHKLSDEKRVLLTTATLREGINIEDENVKIAFCESHILTDIQQFAGRLRLGLDTLYIISDAKQNDVTDKDLDWGISELFYDIGNPPEKTGALNWINEFQRSYIENKDSSLYKMTNYEYEDLLLIVREMNNENWSLARARSKVMNDYIKFISEHNSYIEFNHITNKFEINVYKYREQYRINKILHHSKWRDIVEEYANKHNIEYIASIEDNKITEQIVDIQKVEDYLNSIMGEKVCNHDNGKNELLDTLRELLYLKSGAQAKTINKKLACLNSLYTVEPTSKEMRVNGKRKNQRAYKVVKNV